MKTFFVLGKGLLFLNGRFIASSNIRNVKSTLLLLVLVVVVCFFNKQHEVPQRVPLPYVMVPHCMFHKCSIWKLIALDMIRETLPGQLS